MGSRTHGPSPQGRPSADHLPNRVSHNTSDSTAKSDPPHDSSTQGPRRFTTLSDVDSLGVSLHVVGKKKTSMSGSERPPSLRSLAMVEGEHGNPVPRRGEDNSVASSSNSLSSNPFLGGKSPEKKSPADHSPVDEEEHSDSCPLALDDPLVRWDERLRAAMAGGGTKDFSLAQLQGDFVAEAVRFSQRFIDHLCFGLVKEEVEEARREGGGAPTCALSRGIFYRLVVDLDDPSRDETEMALNVAEVGDGAQRGGGRLSAGRLFWNAIVPSGRALPAMGEKPSAGP